MNRSTWLWLVLVVLVGCGNPKLEAEYRATYKQLEAAKVAAELKQAETVATTTRRTDQLNKLTATTKALLATKDEKDHERAMALIKGGSGIEAGVISELSQLNTELAELLRRSDEIQKQLDGIEKKLGYRPKVE